MCWSVHRWILKKDPLQTCRVLSPCSSLSSNTLSCKFLPAVLPECELCLFSLGVGWALPGLLLAVLQPGNSFKAVSKGAQGLTLFVSFLKVHCPSFLHVNNLKTSFHVFCLFYCRCCFRQVGKSTSRYAILAGSRSWLLIYYCYRMFSLFPLLFKGSNRPCF